MEKASLQAPKMFAWSASPSTPELGFWALVRLGTNLFFLQLSWLDWIGSSRPESWMHCRTSVLFVPLTHIAAVGVFTKCPTMGFIFALLLLDLSGVSLHCHWGCPSDQSVWMQKVIYFYYKKIRKRDQSIQKMHFYFEKNFAGYHCRGQYLSRLLVTLQNAGARTSLEESLTVSAFFLADDVSVQSPRKSV